MPTDSFSQRIGKTHDYNTLRRVNSSSTIFLQELCHIEYTEQEKKAL